MGIKIVENLGASSEAVGGPDNSFVRATQTLTTACGGEFNPRD
jgi:hypothetical protein